MNSPTVQRSWWRVADDTGVPLLLARAVLGLTFILMGFNKIQDPVKFLKDIRDFQMVSEGMPTLLNLMAVVIPWLEVICGGLLLLGVLLSGSGLLLLGMLIVFTSAIFMRTLNVMATEGKPFFEVEFDCGCGGGPTIIWIKLLENIGLTILAVVILASRSRKFCLRASGQRKQGAPPISSTVQVGA